MTDASLDAAAGTTRRRHALSFPLRGVELGVLRLLAFSLCVAFIEPSPYELAFVLAFLVFSITGLRLHATTYPLALALLMFNIGGLFALIPFLDEAPSVRFIIVGIYLAITSLFYAMLLRDDTQARLDALRIGYIFAAFVAACAGIVGYFNVAGLGEALTLYGRASGTFKDPNVLGTFSILGLVWLAQGFLIGKARPLRDLVLFTIILLGGVFLTFSRGAWAHAVGSLGLMAALTFIAADDARVRRRVVLICLTGLVFLACALAVALSVEEIRRVFEIRASLQQSYDLGVQGRFGNQLRSIPELLELPNGYGPLRFRFHFPEDPHNVYINAFASYGWLGGLSYIALVVMTLVAGWRLVFLHSPWRMHAIAIWSTLFVQILQGIQIDTDHWRHWYLMLGLIWGLVAASAARAPAEGSPGHLRTSTKA